MDGWHPAPFDALILVQELVQKLLFWTEKEGRTKEDAIVWSTPNDLLRAR